VVFCKTNCSFLGWLVGLKEWCQAEARHLKSDAFYGYRKLFYRVKTLVGVGYK